MTFTKENPITSNSGNKEKVISIQDIPKEILERANKRLETLTKNKTPGNSRAIIVNMISRAAVYKTEFGPNIA